VRLQKAAKAGSWEIQCSWELGGRPKFCRKNLTRPQLETFSHLLNCTKIFKNLTENFGILPYVKSLDKIKIL